MINSTTALNFLNSKKITLIKYNKPYKTWEIYDDLGFLASDYRLLRAIDKVIGIFVFNNPDLKNFQQKNRGDRWVDLGDGGGYWERNPTKDQEIIENLNNKKQDIWFQNNNWNIGDFDSKNIINFGPDIRKII